MAAEQKRQEKAYAMRYKRALSRDLNLEAIENDLYDMGERCDNVRWMAEDDDTLIEAIGGSEDEAEEFKMMFSDLSADCERLQMDLREEWVPDCFNKFFVAVDTGRLEGWDSYEEDYVSLSPGIESEVAADEAVKSLKTMTKDQLIAAVRQCFRVFQSYMSVKYRYDCLEASLAILEERNQSQIQTIKKIEEVYDKAESASDGFKYCWGKEIEELDRLAAALPQEVWIW